ncbi:MAG: hypothetical protein GY790_22055, partial [Bacteroidetes bacterium]|nr:hypothetical protein [Bacteroidota bacterium]
LQWQNQGIIEGWHGDGNFARTTIMYCLWKSQGISVHPWREDVLAGAVLEDIDPDNQTLYIALRAKRAWEGRLVFDTPRSVQNMNMPLDWPRINQFPQWFTVSPEKEYNVILGEPSFSRGYNKEQIKVSGGVFSGEELARGIPIKLAPGELFRISVSELEVLQSRKQNMFR